MGHEVLPLDVNVKLNLSNKGLGRDDKRRHFFSRAYVLVYRDLSVYTKYVSRVVTLHRKIRLLPVYKGLSSFVSFVVFLSLCLKRKFLY